MTIDSWKLFQTGIKKPLSDLGVEWAVGGMEHTFLSKRNGIGKGTLSALMAKAIILATRGMVVDVHQSKDGCRGMVKTASASEPGKVYEGVLENSLSRFDDASKVGIPNFDEDKGFLNYHLAYVFLAEALSRPKEAKAFLAVYAAILKQLKKTGGAWPEAMLKELLCRACDELYYWIRYTNEKAENANDRLRFMTPFNSDLAGVTHSADDVAINPMAFTDLKVLEDVMKSGVATMTTAPEAGSPTLKPIGVIPTVSEPVAPVDEPKFIGIQLHQIMTAIRSGKNAILIGPTGSGKTTAVEEAILKLDTHTLVRIDGHESLQDIDLIGAIMPAVGGTHQWIDGPLTQAVRWARENPVVVFFDEWNRVPGEHRNLLIPFLNPTPARVCRAMGLMVSGEDDYYLLRLLAINEVVACPVKHLVVLCAGNMGDAYQTYRVEPALRRRFQTTIEFQYLRGDKLKKRLLRQFPAVPIHIIAHIVAINDRVLDMVKTHELRAPIDTGSVLEWTAKMAFEKDWTFGKLMDMAWMTWADIVCGMDGLGLINRSIFHGIISWARTNSPSITPRLNEGKMDVVPALEPGIL